MPRSAWKTKSLRFWIALGMTIALTPIAVSAVVGYGLLNKGVIASFHDVAGRQRRQVIPAQQLRLLMWDALIPVDEFIDEGNPDQPPAYRALRKRIEEEFAKLHEHLAADPEALTLVERARAEWTAADDLANELISVHRPPGDRQTAELMERFHGKIAAASDKLSAVHAVIAGDIEADHDLAVRMYERSEWLAGIAGFLSLLAIICGVFLIGRIMAASVDRLVDGAARFAEGDRDHRIHVDVPPELRRVAEEFNRMIGRIRDSETALAELARRDGLTRLLNRRAFDEALSEIYARMKRSDEEGALLTMDIDHFKRVNDTYGHGAGDDVLSAVAKVMTSEVRPFDHVFRTGGEEFAVILPGVSIDAARDMAERLREVVAATSVSVKDEDVSVTISIGVAKASLDIEPAALVEAADAALYRAKTEGRNRVIVSEENSSAAITNALRFKAGGPAR